MLRINWIAKVLFAFLLCAEPIQNYAVAESFYFQVREVKGKVLDAKNEPLANVNILVKGSDLVVHTNAKGDFKTKLPMEFEGLYFELAGYNRKEVRITGFDDMIVIMEKESSSSLNSQSQKKSIKEQLNTQRKEKVLNSKYAPAQTVIKKFPDVDIQPVGQVKSNYDVVVYGATSAGVVAAYTVAKSGKSVLMIATGEHIGGLSSGGLGQTDIGNKHVVKGISRDFYRQLGQRYGALESWQFEPKEALKIFKSYIKEGNVSFITNHELDKVDKDGAKVNRIAIKSVKDGSVKMLSAKVFIDATYEGDLMAASGISYTIGREGNAKYNETYNGVYLPKFRAESSGYHQFPDNISPYKIPGDPTSGLVFGVKDNKLLERGAADKLTQAYNFRITLTDSVENQIPITRPANYDSTKYELLLRVFEAQPNLREINDYFIWSKMPNRKTDINNRGAFSTDYIGANHLYANATPQERKAIFEDHKNYTQGLLYFYATDPRVPKPLQDYVKKWGYPKDEFLSSGHFSPQLYVREARRMVGEYVMTEHNCLGKEVVQDGIAYAAYTMDSHNTQRIIVDGMVKNEGNVEIGGFSPYPIAYRSLVPKRSEVNNMIVPICMSASHIAYGSIRMEPVFMLLGQVAGLAAVQAVEYNKIVQEVDYKQINAKMDSDPYLKNGAQDIVIDNKNLPVSKKAKVIEKEHKIYYANNLAVYKNQKNLGVNLKDIKSGKYKLYYFVPVVSEIYNDPYYTFKFANKRVEVNLMDHLNSWLLLGEIEIDTAKRSTLNISVDTHVVFDAIQLVAENN